MSEAPNPVETPNPTPNSGTEAAPNPAPAPAGASGDDAPWHASLPDDLKSQPGVLRHATMADAIQAGIAAEKRLGVPADQLVRLPTKPDDKEAYGAIYKALGAPDAADGYKLDLTGASDDDVATVTEFTKAMHEAGPFPPAFLQAAANWYRAETAKAAEAQAAEDAALTKAAETELRTEWGAAYDTTLKEIGKLITDLGGERLAQELDLDSKVGSSPELARFLKKVLDKQAEGGPTADGQRADVGGGAMTPSQAYAARAALEGDPVKGAALMNKSHPQHAAVVEERNRYLAFENPNVAAAARA
ncbi:hypothetical protein [Phenylobacterium sp.]|jgi:hypothetical protein|uniref:hypothetical protein n=1 Tax=Phenylobacterium sp. TaxID=1871053 RepID=UPI0037C88C91